MGKVKKPNHFLFGLFYRWIYKVFAETQPSQPLSPKEWVKFAVQPMIQVAGFPSIVQPGCFNLGHSHEPSAKPPLFWLQNRRLRIPPGLYWLISPINGRKKPYVKLTNTARTATPEKRGLEDSFITSYDRHEDQSDTNNSNCSPVICWDKGVVLIDTGKTWWAKIMPTTWDNCCTDSWMWGISFRSRIWFMYTFSMLGWWNCFFEVNSE